MRLNVGLTFAQKCQIRTFNEQISPIIMHLALIPDTFFSSKIVCFLHMKYESPFRLVMTCEGLQIAESAFDQT